MPRTILQMALFSALVSLTLAACGDETAATTSCTEVCTKYDDLCGNAGQICAVTCSLASEATRTCVRNATTCTAANLCLNNSSSDAGMDARSDAGDAATADARADSTADAAVAMCLENGTGCRSAAECPPHVCTCKEPGSAPVSVEPVCIPGDDGGTSFCSAQASCGTYCATRMGTQVWTALSCPRSDAGSDAGSDARVDGGN